ncbi:MAG: DNA mismatch repair endonuclease MutL [Deltaproteobacteria bacterium]|nr:DNA mismatch repair endonuclease MutL [Deltaproteobacteria bacterium]
MAERRVRVLPDEVANQIAAGEVVERPASVVKELVENAVDAGASRVRVRVEGAGREALVVEDDGSGMGRDDALLAFERHATSKIASADDLERIATLGFRGEALPSIASVSRFTLTTRAGRDTEGTRVRIEGGRLVSVDVAGAPRGTTAEVRDLFFNVPARRKFLKTDATELRNVVETLAGLALVHDGVGFELRSSGRLLLAVAPALGLEERVGELLGPEAPGGFSWFRTEADGRRLALALAAPHEGRSHARGVRLFVNGRPVQDRLLFRALVEGYRGLLGSRRYPLALLWLELPADQVDVNVHPAKREVRLRDEGRTFRWVAGSVAEALARGPGPKPGEVHPSEVPGPGTDDVSALSGPAVDATRRVAEALEVYASRADPTAEALARARGFAPRPAVLPLGPARTERGEVPGSAGSGPAVGGVFAGLRYLGAFDATYLLFEDPDGPELVLVDQHAAHERILYEALLGEDSAGAPRWQPLLFPVTLECTAGELAALEERRAPLESLGFRVEHFGGRSVAVTEAPAGLPPAAVEAVVRDLLGAEDLVGAGAGPADRRHAAAARAACSGAVKARSALLASEASELLARLGRLRHPTHCPHGRPLFVRMTREELERMFHRT